jgi:hypothetical protein
LMMTTAGPSVKSKVEAEKENHNAQVFRSSGRVRLL